MFDLYFGLTVEIIFAFIFKMLFKCFGVYLGYVSFQGIVVIADMMLVIREKTKQNVSFKQLSGYWAIVGFCIVVSMATGYFSYHLICN